MQQHFFCPNPDCPWHTSGESENDWYTPNGFYPTKVSGSVARFKCKSCNTGFSTQTFALDYYVKKKSLTKESKTYTVPLSSDVDYRNSIKTV